MVSERIALVTEESARTWIVKRFEIHPSSEAVRACVLGTMKPSAGWMHDDDASSCGSVVYAKARLNEQRQLWDGPPDEPDDVPLMMVGNRKREVIISPVARSKMFRTPLVVFPIDLTSGRVSGIRQRLVVLQAKPMDG